MNIWRVYGHKLFKSIKMVMKVMNQMNEYEAFYMNKMNNKWKGWITYVFGVKRKLLFDEIWESLKEFSARKL